MKKLRAEDVMRMRHARARGATYKELAASFKVSTKTVANVVKGRTWAHLGGPLDVGRDLRTDLRAVADRHGMRLQDIAKWVRDGGLDD